GQVGSRSDPSGNVTTLTYDGAGRETERETIGTAGAARADIALAYNRSGHILSEDSTISGDPTNGVTTYTYDPVARLTTYLRSGATTSYAWDKVPNRT